MSPSVAPLVLTLLVQGTQPLKKTDLIRLLSSATLPPAEIAELVRRHCLSFTPSPRDKSDLRSLGADAALMRRIDDCARRSAALRATLRLREAIVVAGARAVVTVQVERGDAPAEGIRVVLRGSGRVAGGTDVEATTDARGAARFELRGTSVGTHRLTAATASGDPFETAAGADLTVRPAPAVVAPARTGFVSGMSQKGRVGTRLPLPLVFQVRDTTNAPVAGQVVKLTAVNAQLEGAAPATDSTGQIRVTVKLGERAGPVRITAVLGNVEREATHTALAGPPSRLRLRCGAAAVDGRVTVAAGGDLAMDVRAQDGFGNAVPLTGLRVNVGDDDVARATALTADTTIGHFTLHGVRAGSTNLVVLASGLRESVVAAVSAGAAVPCRAAAPRD
jgi:hypothetical protein